MKKLLPFLIIIFCSVTGLFAQEHQDSLNIPSDSVYMFRSLFGPQYYYQEQRVNFNQLKELVWEDADQFRLYKQARFFNTTSRVTVTAGGFLVGWSLIASATEGDPNWNLAYIGGGIILASIPLNILYINKADKIVTKYNADLPESLAKSHSPQLRLGFAGCGLSLKVQF